MTNPIRTKVTLIAFSVLTMFMIAGTAIAAVSFSGPRAQSCGGVCTHIGSRCGVPACQSFCMRTGGPQSNQGWCTPL